MKNLLLLVLTMAVVTSCIAPKRLVAYKAIPNATVLEVDCETNAYKKIGLDMAIARMTIDPSGRDFGQLKGKIDEDIEIVATILDSSRVEFTGSYITKSSGEMLWGSSLESTDYSDAKNNRTCGYGLCLTAWNEIVHLAETGSCVITGSRLE